MISQDYNNKNAHDWKKILDDGWTAVTLDGKPSVHFEHTVCVTPLGKEILTECQSTRTNKC